MSKDGEEFERQFFSGVDGEPMKEVVAQAMSGMADMIRHMAMSLDDEGIGTHATIREIALFMVANVDDYDNAMIRKRNLWTALSFMELVDEKQDGEGQ